MAGFSAPTRAGRRPATPVHHPGGSDAGRNRGALRHRVRDGFADHPLAGGELGQAGPHQGGGDIEDLRGVADQVRLGQVAVPAVGGLRQRVLDAGVHPLRAVVRIPTAWAILSAVLNPIPHTSAANRYGSLRTTEIDPSP